MTDFFQYPYNGNDICPIENTIEPGNVSSSQNPIQFETEAVKITGSNSYATGVFTIQTTGATNLIGSSISIATPDSDLKYYFGLGENEIPVIGNSVSKLCINMANFLEEQPDINYLYNVVYSSTKVILRAKEYGSRYNLTISTDSSNIGVQNVISNSLDVLEGSIPSGVWLKIYVEDEYKIKFAKNYDVSDYTFDISDVLDAFAERVEPTTFANLASTKYQNLVLYYATLGVNYFDGQNLTALAQRSVGKYFWSGKRTDKSNASYTSGSRELLTNMPNLKTTFAGAKELISFLGLTPTKENAFGSSLNITFTATFLDGTTDSFTLLRPVSDFIELRYFQFTTDWILTQFNGNVNMFSVTIPTNTINTYKQASYLIVDAPVYNTEIVFENQLGGLDIAHFESVKDTSIETSFASYSKLNLTTRDIEQTVYEKNGRSKFSISTGWINNNEMEWLKELLISKNVWVLNEDNTYTGIVITEHEFNYNELNQKSRLKIEYNYKILE